MACSSIAVSCFPDRVRNGERSVPSFKSLLQAFRLTRAWLAFYSTYSHFTPLSHYFFTSPQYVLKEGCPTSAVLSPQEAQGSLTAQLFYSLYHQHIPLSISPQDTFPSLLPQLWSQKRYTQKIKSDRCINTAMDLNLQAHSLSPHQKTCLFWMFMAWEQEHQEKKN